MRLPLKFTGQIDPVKEALCTVKAEDISLKDAASDFRHSFSRRRFSSNMRSNGDIWQNQIQTFLTDEFRQRTVLNQLPQDRLLRRLCELDYRYTLYKSKPDLAQILQKPRSVVRRFSPDCLHPDRIHFAEELLGSIYEIFLCYGYQPSDIHLHNLLLECILTPLQPSAQKWLQANTQVNTEIDLIAAGFGDMNEPDPELISSAAIALAGSLMKISPLRLRSLILAYTENKVRRLYLTLLLRRSRVHITNICIVPR